MLGSKHPNQTPATQEKTNETQKISERKPPSSEAWKQTSMGRSLLRCGRVSPVPHSRPDVRHDERPSAGGRSCLHAEINGGEGQAQELRPILVSEFVN